MYHFYYIEIISFYSTDSFYEDTLRVVFFLLLFYFFFFWLIVEFCTLFIVDMCLSNMCFANIFFWSVACFFHYLPNVFNKSLTNFEKVQFINFLNIESENFLLSLAYQRYSARCFHLREVMDWEKIMCVWQRRAGGGGWCTITSNIF